MSLEQQLGNSDQPIRVDSLAATPLAPAPTRRFDAARDLTHADLESAFEWLDSLRSHSAVPLFAGAALALRTLDPSQDLGIDAAQWGRIKAQLDAIRIEPDFFIALARYRAIDPAFDFELTDADRARFGRLMDIASRGGPAFVGLAAAMKQLDPSWRVDFTDADRVKALETLDADRSDEDWLDFGNVALGLQTLDPQHRVEITDADWSAMIAKLKEYRSLGDWYYLLHLAAAMQQLAATPSGENLAPATTPPLPATPNFT